MPDESKRKSQADITMVDGDSGWGKPKGSPQPQLPWKLIALVGVQVAVSLVFVAIIIRWFFVFSP